MTEAPLELGAVLIGSTPKELVSKARAVVVPTTARADAATVEAVSITLWRVGQVPSVKKLFLLQHAATAATRGGLHRSAVPNTALGTAADAQDGAVDDDDETEGAVPGEPASPPAVRERRDGHSSISGSISVGTPYNVAANDSPFSTAVRESIEAMTAPTTAPSEKSAEISSSSAELSGRSLGGKISSLFGAGRGALGKGVEIAGQLREIAKRTDHPLSPAGWAQVASPRTLPPPPTLNPHPSPLTPRPSPLTPQAKGLRVLFTDAVRLRAAGEWSAVSGTVSGAAPSADEGAVMGTSLEEVVAAVAAVPTTAPLAVRLPPPPDDDDDDDDVADEMARAAVEGTRAVASAVAGGGSGGSGACIPSAVASAVLSGGSGACMPSAAPSPKPSSMPTDSTAGGAVLSAASPVALIDSLLQAGAIPLMTPDDP